MLLLGEPYSHTNTTQSVRRSLPAGADVEGYSQQLPQVVFRLPYDRLELRAAMANLHHAHAAPLVVQQVALRFLQHLHTASHNAQGSDDCGCGKATSTTAIYFERQ